jgi:hypothetical protein
MVVFMFFGFFHHTENQNVKTKNRLETLSILVLEGVEALYNKVKQCPSHRLEHFAKLFLLYY